MPLLPSSTLLTLTSFSLSTISLLLIISPTTLLPSPTISLLGSSMSIPTATYSLPSPPSPAARLLSGVTHVFSPSELELFGLLGYLGVLVSFTMILLSRGLAYSRSDLTSFTDDKGVVTRKESMQMAEECYAVLSAQGLWQLVSTLHVFLSGALVAWVYLGSSAVLAVLRNDVVFVVGLVDMLFFGYLWTLVKEERREVLTLLMQRRETDEQDRVSRGE